MRNFFGKSIFVVIIMIMASTTVFAQGKGKMAIGGNLNIGSGSDLTNFGLGVKFQYGITKEIRLEPSFNYFFEASNVSMWDLGVNAHYLFRNSSNKSLTLYPIAGLALVGTKLTIETDPIYMDGELIVPGTSTSATGSDIGINFGGGIEYKLNSKVSLSGEAKYQVVEDYSRFIISGGINFYL